MANVYGPEIHSLPNCILAVDAADPRSYVAGPELVTNSALTTAGDGSFETVFRDATTFTQTSTGATVLAGKTYHVSWRTSARRGTTSAGLRVGLAGIAGSPNVNTVAGTTNTLIMTANISGAVIVMGDAAGTDFDLDYLSIREGGATWYDMSPRKNHMTQTVASQTPTFGTAAGLNYFTFNSAQRHFKSIYTAPVSNDNEFALTAIVGLAETERRNFNGIISCGLERSNSAFARFALVSYNYQSSTYGQGLGTDMWAPAGRRTTLGNSLPLDTPTVAAWVIPRWQDMKTTTKIFMNGVEAPTFSYGGSTVSTTAVLNPFKWYFGNWQVTRTDMDFQGRFYFVYLFDTALSDATIAQYYQKLKSRVGH